MLLRSASGGEIGDVEEIVDLGPPTASVSLPLLAKRTESETSHCRKADFFNIIHLLQT